MSRCLLGRSRLLWLEERGARGMEGDAGEDIEGGKNEGQNCEEY